MANNQTLSEKIKNFAQIGKVPSELSGVSLSGAANRSVAERLLYSAYTGKVPTEVTASGLNNQTLADALYTTFGRDPTGLSSVNSPLSIMLAGADFYIDPTQASTITGSPVSVINSPRTDGFTTSPNFQRNTLASPADRPAITASRLVFDGSNDVLDQSAGYSYVTAYRPADPQYAEQFKGPTTTGIARANDGTWWVGHYGKKNQGTAAGETFDGSIIHYSSDFSTIIQEIRFQSLALSDVGCQGIAIDGLDGKIWVADTQNGKIYKINPVGPSVDANFTFASVNGLTYDTINNQLIVCVANSVTITRVNRATGATISTAQIRDITNNSLDMLFFEASHGTQGALYTTCRDNGTNGRIIKYDVASNYAHIKAWSITEVKAVEGLCIYNNEFYICDDEYYHDQPAGVNRIVRVSVDPTATDYGTKLVIAGVAKIASAPAGAVALAVGGDPLSTGGPTRRGVGTFFTNTANQFRVISMINGTQVSQNWTVASYTTEFLFYVVIDTVAHTATLYENGVINGTAQSDANLTGSIPHLAWTLGADYESAGVAARFGAVSIGGLIVTTDTTHQSEIEGFLSWQTKGSGSLLPVGHTYKNSAPT